MEGHPGKGELHHFIRMQELMAETRILNFTKFEKKVSLLKKQFEERFIAFSREC
jgi:hypothetical protein